MKRFKSFWTGFASILVLFPSSDVSHSQSVVELMDKSWRQVGDSMRDSNKSYVKRKRQRAA